MPIGDLIMILKRVEKVASLIESPNPERVVIANIIAKTESKIEMERAVIVNFLVFLDFLKIKTKTRIDKIQLMTVNGAKRREF